jgi:hypothetical protein
LRGALILVKSNKAGTLITNNNITMGIEELVLHLTKAEGKAEGKIEEVRNLITKLGLSDEQAADVAGVTIEFVKQVRATLKEQ